MKFKFKYKYEPEPGTSFEYWGRFVIFGMALVGWLSYIIEKDVDMSPIANAVIVITATAWVLLPFIKSWKKKEEENK
jgi:hypothetical protein